jgi:enamine deaminase RidA (YjgF/YER057c/UK114 family)
MSVVQKSITATPQNWVVEDVYSKVISPAAHYTMGRKVGPFFYLAGQIAAIPEQQKIIRGYQDLPEEIAKTLRTGSMNADFKEGPIVSQAWFIWNNIKLLLEEQGSNLDNILFVTTYITNMEWFPSLARVRNMFFPGVPPHNRTYPPATVIEVPQLGLSRDVLLEVEVVAFIPQS